MGSEVQIGARLEVQALGNSLLVCCFNTSHDLALVRHKQCPFEIAEKGASLIEGKGWPIAASSKGVVSNSIALTAVGAGLVLVDRHWERVVMRSSTIGASLFLAFAFSASAAAQSLPGASLNEMAATPLVRVNISENLRTPPDEATLTAGTQAKAPTATAAVAASKVKTEKLLATIRAAGIRDRDIQTQGIQLSTDYRWDPEPNGRGRQTLIGYVAGNSVQIKTRDIGALTQLLDALATAGADSVYGPTFGISDPAPLRREARVRAMARGAAEASEYARNNGFTRVRLLSVEEGTSYRGTDIVVTGSRISNLSSPPPPPPPAPERDGGIVAPGQIETGVALNLLYRMEK